MKKKKFFYLILSLGTFVFMNFSKTNSSTNIGLAVAYYLSDNSAVSQTVAGGVLGGVGAHYGAKVGASIGWLGGPGGAILGGIAGAL